MLIAQSLNFGEEAETQGLPGAEGFDVTDPGASFGTTLEGILSGIMVIAGLMVLLYLLWGGIEWITSGGDKAKTEKARNRMTQAVIGIIVLAATTAIFIIVQSFLGISVIDFGNSTTKSPAPISSPKVRASGNPDGLGPRPSGNKQ